VNNTNSGLAVNAGGVVQAKNSVFSNNGAFGMIADSSTLDAQTVTASNNGTGVHAQNSGTIRMSEVSVVSNGTGISTASGGVINSFGDNLIAGNGTGNGGVTPISKQ